jgi:hypothetical protein
VSSNVKRPRNRHQPPVPVSSLRRLHRGAQGRACPAGGLPGEDFRRSRCTCPWVSWALGVGLCSVHGSQPSSRRSSSEQWRTRFAIWLTEGVLFSSIITRGVCSLLIIAKSDEEETTIGYWQLPHTSWSCPSTHHCTVSPARMGLRSPSSPTVKAAGTLASLRTSVIVSSVRGRP